MTGRRMQRHRPGSARGAEEIAEALIEFRQRRPIFSRMVCRIPGWKWSSTYEEFLELSRRLHGIAFRPK